MTGVFLTNFICGTFIIISSILHYKKIKKLFFQFYFISYAFLGFYLLLLSLSIDYRISAIGAIAFAFSSYFFIIIMAGHMTKAHAIGYVPMVVAGVLYTFRTNKIIFKVIRTERISLNWLLIKK